MKRSWVLYPLRDAVAFVVDDDFILMDVYDIAFVVLFRKGDQQ